MRLRIGIVREKKGEIKSLERARRESSADSSGGVPFSYRLLKKEQDYAAVFWLLWLTPSYPLVPVPGV